jgi:hypothetical protein
MNLRWLNASNVKKVLVEVVGVAIVEAEVDLLKTHAELISLSSLVLLLLRSVNDTKRRDFASSVTRMDIVSSRALK